MSVELTKVTLPKVTAAAVELQTVKLGPQAGGGGGGGFVLPVAGADIWLEADQLSLSDNDPVATWPDASGNGRDFVQATGANQPLFKAGVLNGHPSVLFDTSDFLENLVFVPGHPYTMLCVFQTTGLIGSSRRAVQFKTQNTMLLGFVSSKVMYYADGPFVGDPGPTRTSGVHYFAQVEQAAGSASLRVNGSAIIETELNNPSVYDNLTLGGQGAFAEPLDGHITLFAMYPFVLDAAQRADIESYILTKYAL